jgi:hypothetical protein
MVIKNTSYVVVPVLVLLLIVVLPLEHTLPHLTGSTVLAFG